jgi:hypothetical protein
MKTTASLSLSFFLLVASTAAQDHSGGAMPNPKVPEHDALAKFVGKWHCDVTINMPGMGEQKSTATEETELVCNGLFARSIVNGTMMGMPMQGISLVGYDANEKRYTALWVDSMSPEAEESVLTVDLDAKTRTWTSKRLSGPGAATRAVMTFKDDDTIEQASYMADADGKETRVFHILKKRQVANAKPAGKATANAEPASTKVAAQTDAQAVAPHAQAQAKVQPAQAAPTAKELAGYVGKWATVMTMGPAADGEGDKGTEVNSAACNGMWLWADFKSTFMGGPFEGHSLTACAGGKVVTYWIDSTNGYVSKLTGTHDAKTGAMTLQGHTRDPMGGQMETTEKATWTSEHSRELTMEFKTPEGPMTMKIAYRRQHQDGAHAIKK